MYAGLHGDLELTPAQAEGALAGWLGTGVHCTGLERLHGGMLNSVWRLTFDRAPHEAVIKVRPPGDGAFAAEATALRYLRRETRFPCPQVYHEDSSGRHLPLAYLLMERLPGVTLGSIPLGAGDRAAVERELAGALLELHTHTRDTYGGIDEPGEKDWAPVFLRRLLAMRREMEGRLPAGVLGDIDRALRAAETALRESSPPTLVHGDIWSANVLIAEDESGWHLAGILDPSAEYADVELELAYLEGFGSVGPAFWEAYAARAPLRPGYEFRRLFYWLNTYMVHVWYFGDAHYREKTAEVAAAIAQGV